MPLTTNSTVWRIIFSIFIFLTAIFVILFHFQDLFIVLIMGFILVMATDKILVEFDKRFGHKSLWTKRIYAIIILLASLFACYLFIMGQLADIGSLLTSPQDEYDAGISSIFSEYGHLLSTPDGKPILSDEQLRSIGNSMFSSISDILSKLSYFIFTGVLIIPLIFKSYFSKKNVMMKEFIELFPVKYQDCVDSSIRDIKNRLRDYFSAKILESVIVGIICCIGFYFSGINGWFFLGALAGLLNIVPYVGPIIGAVPAVIVAFIVSPTTALYAIITVVIAQLVDNLYLIPYMISGKVNVNPLLSILLTLTFASMLGALGMILAIPIYIVYKVALTEFYQELLKIYPDDG
ncbi:AI-2E family transporter [Methanolobus sp. WCC1]|uniref:AI-2E family transporter n=1 Tax=unclassified Methanolobus TaxID=2629569 RepID=UPI0032500E32